MRKSVKSVVACALFGSIILPVAVRAETELPYFGPDAVPCEIKVPSNPLNAGYLRNENCKVAFVLPPLQGQMGIENFWASSSDLLLCKVVKSNLEILAGSVDIHARAQKEYTKIQEEMPTLSDQAYDQAVKRLAKVGNNIGNLGRIVDQAQKIVNGIGGNQNSMQLHVSFTLGAWDNLIRQYEEANSGRGIIFRRLPVTGGFLNYRMKLDENNLVLRGLDLEPNLDWVLSSKINGLGPSNIDWDKITADGGLFPGFLKNLSENTVTFAGSASGYIELNLRGACNVAGYDPNASLTVSSSGMANFTPTYTYFYPIQSKSVFSISLSPNAYAESIKAAIVPGGDVSSARLYNEIVARKGLLFEYDGGLKNQDTELLRTQYEATFTKFFTEQILSQVGVLVELGKKAHTRTEFTVASSRRCESHLFGMIERCHDHHYHVPHEVIDWKKVAETVLQKMNSWDPKMKVQKYYNVFGFGTSSFKVEQKWEQK